MKFLCITEFVHSGVRIYNTGTVYELNENTAGELIALDKKKPLGALLFFKPVDDTAIKYVKAIDIDATVPAETNNTHAPKSKENA